MIDNSGVGGKISSFTGNSSFSSGDSSGTSASSSAQSAHSLCGQLSTVSSLNSEIAAYSPHDWIVPSSRVSVSHAGVTIALCFYTCTHKISYGFRNRASVQTAMCQSTCLRKRRFIRIAVIITSASPTSEQSSIVSLGVFCSTWATKEANCSGCNLADIIKILTALSSKFSTSPESSRWRFIGRSFPESESPDSGEGGWRDGDIRVPASTRGISPVVRGYLA